LMFMIEFEKILDQTLLQVVEFYDRRKVGEVGHLGFRRSSDLHKVFCCLKTMIGQGLFVPADALFLDMGCADGRVSVLMSYLAKTSVGIELDEWTLDDYGPLRKELDALLTEKGLLLPPKDIFLYHGDSMDESLHDRVHHETGVSFDQFDLFYTYLTMQEEFAELIARKAKPGAFFMVYGLEKILPRFTGLRLLTSARPMEGIIALYQKT
jgi:SAM-dependent methyltransferase